MVRDHIVTADCSDGEELYMGTQDRAIPASNERAGGQFYIGSTCIYGAFPNDMPIFVGSSRSVTFSVRTFLDQLYGGNLSFNAWCCFAAIADHRSTLKPAECALVAKASSRRIAEFSTGRYCARQALERFGCSDSAVLADKYGAPIWPAGYMGSISHCSDLAVAVVATRSAGISFGVDIEDAVNIEDEVVAMISSPNELEKLLVLPRCDLPISWRTVLFSAKESAFKAIFSATGSAAAPRDISVTIDVDGSFSVAWDADDATGAVPLLLVGRWLMWRQAVFTMAWIRP